MVICNGYFLENRLSYLRDLLSSQKIEPADYRIMKAGYTEKLEKLEVKLASVAQKNSVDFEGLLTTGISNLLTLETNYKNGDIERKREIIGSIYPEKLTFDGFAFRTARLNEAVSLIYSIGAGFSQQKKDKKKKFSLVLSGDPDWIFFKPIERGSEPVIQDQNSDV